MPHTAEIQALRVKHSGFALQRDVNRIMEELNPTTSIVRRTMATRSTVPVPHMDLPSRNPADGSVRWKPFAANQPERRRERRRAATSMDDYADGRDDEPHEVNPLAVKLRVKATRRLARDAAKTLRRGLMQSEQRLRLCKNGVQAPYDEEHVPLWDSEARAAALQAARTATVKRIKAKSPPRQGATPSPKAVPLAAPTATLGSVLPPPSATPDGPVTTAVHFSAEGDDVLSEGDDDVDDVFGTDDVTSSFFFTDVSAQQAMPLPRLMVQQPSTLQPRGAPSETPASEQHLSSSQLPPLVGGSKPGDNTPSPSPSQQQQKALEQQRLHTRFKSVNVRTVMAPDYVPPAPEVPQEVQTLSSKLVSHPKFRMEMTAASDKFYNTALHRFDRRVHDQVTKYEKKYAALDVSGAALPFRATAAAVLHHVEAVIRRDERMSARQDAFDAELRKLDEVRTFVAQSYIHPSVFGMLRAAEGYFRFDRAMPGPSDFFDQIISTVDDADFLFDDVVSGAVHIATLFGVQERAVIQHVRGRAAHFIHDRPTQLERALQHIEGSTVPSSSKAGSPRLPAGGRGKPSSKTPLPTVGANPPNRELAHRDESMSIGASTSKHPPPL